MPMPTEGEILEALGAEYHRKTLEASMAMIASRQAVITLRLAIAAERIADALEAMASQERADG
jgi:hypothetical protein